MGSLFVCFVLCSCLSVLCPRKEKVERRGEERREGPSQGASQDSQKRVWCTSWLSQTGMMSPAVCNVFNNCDLRSSRSACSVAASYKPPMLVTRARLPACAVLFLAGKSLAQVSSCCSCAAPLASGSKGAKRAHSDLNQGPADLQSAALTTELCTQLS